MEVTSRDAAIAAGSSTYFTGNPCPRGHTAPRRTINRSCLICSTEARKASIKARYANDPAFAAKVKARSLAWQKANPERYRERLAKWGAENREHLLAHARAYSKAHPSPRNKDLSGEKLAKKREQDRRANQKQYQNPEFRRKATERATKWRRENRERYNAQVRDWKQRNPERAKEIAAAGGLNRRAKEKQLGKVSAADIKAIRSRRTCAVCDVLHPKMEIDHIKAISRGGNNDLSNLQLLCRHCNRTKWAKDIDEWLDELTRPS